MRFLLLGAGGFAKEVADLVESLGHQVVALFQDAGTTPHFGHATARYPTVSSASEVEFDALALAVGTPASRLALYERFAAVGPFPTLLHATATISPNARLGSGVLVMQNAVVNADAVVESGVLLNVATCVAHDCVVGEFCHLAPVTQLGGGSTVGRLCNLGTSTVVLPGVKVAERTVSGAGAVITKDTLAGTTVVGVPARALSVGSSERTPSSSAEGHARGAS